MNTYRATILPTQLPDGSWTEVKTYDYQAYAPVAWSGMNPPDQHELIDTTAAASPPVLPTVYEGRRDLTKLEFRRLFGPQEQRQVDRFNATFESLPILSEEQRDDVRTGLENYKAAQSVSLDDPATVDALGTYMVLGILAESRVVEILRG